MHVESPQSDFEMGLAIGEVISWMKAAFQKIHDDNMDNNSIRETINECIEILGKPSTDNVDKAGDKACESLGII